MSKTTELLDSVRDIQEPVPPESSSALVLGLVALLIVLLTIAALVTLHKRRNKINRELRSELQAIESDQPETALVKIAVILRRVMHHIHGDKINHLEGNQWLDALNSTFSTRYFTQGNGVVLGNTLYNTTSLSKTDTRALARDVSKLISKTRFDKKLSAHRVASMSPQP